MIHSPNDTRHQFEAATLVESNSPRVVAMNHQHKPLRLLLCLPVPLLGYLLRRGNQVRDQLVRVSPVRVGRLASIASIDAKHRDERNRRF